MGCRDYNFILTPLTSVKWPAFPFFATLDHDNTVLAPQFVPHRIHILPWPRTDCEVLERISPGTPALGHGQRRSGITEAAGGLTMRSIKVASASKACAIS